MNNNISTQFGRLINRAIAAALILLAAFGGVYSAERIVVTIIKNKDISYYNELIDGFKSALSEYNINPAYSEMTLGDDESVSLVKSKKPHLMFVLGLSTLLRVSDAVHDVPIVYSAAFAEGDDVVKGPNVTGANFYVSIAEQCRKLRQIVPKIKRIGVIFNPDSNGKTMLIAQQKLLGLGFTLVSFPARNPTEITKLENMQVDALWLFPDPVIAQQSIITQLIFSEILTRKPIIGMSKSSVKAGAFFALTCDYKSVGTQAGEMAAKVLQGKDISAIDVSNPREFKLFLNKSIAEKIRIPISQQILSEASEVFG